MPQAPEGPLESEAPQGPTEEAGSTPPIPGGDQWWRYPAYGLASGLGPVLFGVLGIQMPSGGLASWTYVIFFLGGVVLWVKLLQLAAEHLIGIPFQIRHILIALVASFLLSAILITLIPFSTSLMMLAGFALAGGAAMRYFAA